MVVVSDGEDEAADQVVVGKGGCSLVIHMSKCHSITAYSVIIINQQNTVLFWQTKLPTETGSSFDRTTTQYFDSQIYRTIEKQREWNASADSPESIVELFILMTSYICRSHSTCVSYLLLLERALHLYGKPRWVTLCVNQVCCKVWDYVSCTRIHLRCNYNISLPIRIIFQ